MDSGWGWCQHKVFLRYICDFPETSGKKADLGTCTHKALELLARRKLSEQNGLDTFIEEEIGKTFLVKDITPDFAAKEAFAHYSTPGKNPHVWTEADYDLIRGWIDEVLYYNDGAFSPLKRTIVSPEQYFDIEIKEPWAWYSYELEPGKKIEGYLRIRGTIDLVTEPLPGSIEYIDWKTGRRFDWVKGKVKEYADLCEDPQLHLYHYALRKLYPQIDNLMVTIFFVSDGGPYTIPFKKSDMRKTEDMLRRRFEEIRRTTKPKLLYSTPKERWKCTKLCNFYSTNMEGSNKSICRHVADEIIEMGIDRVTIKYGGDKASQRYSGGGATNREERA